MSIQDVLKKYKDVINTEPPIYYFPFSAISLNRAIGDMRGLRGGRLYQIAGKESSGKTTLSLDLIKNAQEMGRMCVYIDFEHTFDELYAQKLGVDTNTLILVNPMTAETGFDIVEALAQNKIEDTDEYPLLFVIDSIPAIVPKGETDKTYGDSQKVADSAGLITRFCKRIVPIIRNTGAIVVVINQLRANFSTMSKKETKLYGPFQLHHSTSIRLDLTRMFKEADRIPIDVTVAKNKLGAEQQKTEIDLIYANGIDIKGDILKLAIEQEIIQVTGKGRFEYNGIKAHGEKQALANFPMDEIKEKVLTCLMN